MKGLVDLNNHLDWPFYFKSDLQIANNHDFKVVIFLIWPFQEILQDLKTNISEAENTLKYVVRPNSTIFAKWKLYKLSTQMLSLNTMVQSKAETDQAEIEARRELLDMDSLESVVTNITNSVDELKNAVEEKEKSVWSLHNFKGKVIFNKLIIDNLTISQLNTLPVDSFLQNVFR